MASSRLNAMSIGLCGQLSLTRVSTHYPGRNTELGSWLTLSSITLRRDSIIKSDTDDT